MRVLTVALGLILWFLPPSAFADDHHVDFDSQADFSIPKTFSIREGRVSSSRPEIDNPLLLKKIGETIRRELIAKGLKEKPNRPDFVVDYSVTGVEIRVGARGRGRGNAGAENQVDRFSEGTLVVDLSSGDSGALVWRGVYHDRESNSSKFAQNVPGDARKLLTEYPTTNSKTTIPTNKNVTVPLPPADPAVSIAHLDATRLALDKTSAALRQANTRDKGQTVAMALADVARALDHVASAMDYIREHPELNDTQPVRPPTMPNFTGPESERGLNVNMELALVSLQTAFDELGRVPGGTLGGLRNRINEDIAAAASDVLAGIDLAARTRAGRGNTPPTTGSTPRVTGKVAGVDPGALLRGGATVSLTLSTVLPGAGNVVQRATVRVDGTFDFPDVASGRYILRLSGENIPSNTCSGVAVGNAEVRNVEIAVPRQSNRDDVQIISAIYGARQGSSDVTPVVMKLTRPELHEFYAAPKWLGVDPANGSTKNLVIFYLNQCEEHVFNAEEPEAVSYAILAQHANPALRLGSPSPDSNRNELQIVDAWFGLGSTFVSVTPRLREILRPGGQPFTISDAALNTPEVTHWEELIITSLYQGRRSTFHISKGNRLSFAQLLANAQSADLFRPQNSELPDWLR